MRKASILAFGLASLGAAADDPPGFLLLKAPELRGMETQLARKLTPQKSASEQIEDFGTHLFMVAHLEASGAAEIHENMADIFVVQTGEATLTVGGKVLEAKTTAPGEIRGAAIEGGVTKKMEAGDVAHIPAGTPHHTQVTAGQQVTYLVIKVRAK